MTLPLTTTTVTVANRASAEPNVARTYPTVTAAGLPAHIGPVSSFDARAGGGQESHDAALFVESAVERGAKVTDDTTGTEWYAGACNERTGLGLGHFVVELYRVAGRVPT